MRGAYRLGEPWLTSVLMFNFCSAWLSISVSWVSGDYRLRVDVLADVADVELLLDVLRLQRAHFFEDLQLVVDLVRAVVVQVWSECRYSESFRRAGGGSPSCSSSTRPSS